MADKPKVKTSRIAELIERRNEMAEKAGAPSVSSKKDSVWGNLLEHLNDVLEDVESVYDHAEKVATNIVGPIPKREKDSDEKGSKEPLALYFADKTHDILEKISKTCKETKEILGKLDF